MTCARNVRSAFLAALCSLFVLSHGQSTCVQIPKCAAGRCSTGTGNYAVCTQCQATYQLQNGGRTCVCGPGKYDDGSKCAACPFGSYCKGIAASYVSSSAETTANRGAPTACDVINAVASSGLTTKIRATNHTACVLKPGYLLSSSIPSSPITASTQTATVCPANTYSTGGGRQRACTACASGLITTGNSAADHSASSKCKVPAGSYIDNGAVKPCEKGFYRVGDALPSLATSCTSCGTGISTADTGSTARTACVVVLPGYEATWDPTGYAKDATACQYGYYWPGGVISTATTCTSCNGYTTKTTSSASKADCAAPPGYYKPTSENTLKLCPTSVNVKTSTNDAAYSSLANKASYEAYGTFGTYRAGWATTPNGVKDCRVCGAGVDATGNLENQHPTDSPELVAGSSDACFIKPGQSLVSDINLDPAISLYKAIDCPAGTYGATTATSGLRTSYCTSCSRGFVTDAPKSTSAADCINPAGFGVLGKSAIQCAPGSWAAKASMLPCQPCAEGRNTTSVFATQQIAATDCFVMDGYGIYNQEGATAAAQWYDDAADVPTNPADKLALDVSKCPIGRYSNSEDRYSTDIAARCVSCPVGSLTVGKGSTSADDCTVCMSGYGRAATQSAGNMECSECERGTFNGGDTVNPLTGDDRSDWVCISCGTKAFEYQGQDTFTSASTTMKIGSGSADQCVPVNAQLDTSVGTSLMSGYIVPSTQVSNGLISDAANSLVDCVDKCATTAGCHFAEFRYDDNSGDYAAGCFLFAPTVPSSGALSIYYKLPPTFEVAASSAAVHAQSIASGLYAKYSYGSDLELHFGDNLSTAGTDTEAASNCNMMSNCWGFVETAASGDAKFVLKTGNDLVNARTMINSMKTGETADSTIIVQL